MRILGLALREAVMPMDLRRTPEPSAEMNSRESIEGFHQEGAASLSPVYHFNARAIDALAPCGSSLVDLGCGSGQFLAYLATCRPDLQITGIDLAGDMVQAGREMLARKGLEQRVRLVVGDMREFRSIAPRRVGLISSVFSLHHLPTHGDLTACLQEMAAAVTALQARVWIFDHARPRRGATARRFPEVFTPHASVAFKLDSCNSLKASWSFRELREALDSTMGVPVRSSLARLLPVYQLHWLGKMLPDSNHLLWRTPDALLTRTLEDAASLARLFRRPPGW